MRLKLFWLQKLRAFRKKGLSKKTKFIAAASESSINKDTAIHITAPHAVLQNCVSRSSSFLETPKKGARRKPQNRFSQVVASFGCGSTAPLRMRRERNRPRVYSEEEDNSQVLPVDAFGRMNRACNNQKEYRRQNDEDDRFSRDGCLDAHPLTTKRWVGACRCIHDVVDVDKSSTRSDEVLLSRKLQKELRSHGQVETKTILSSESRSAESNGAKSKIPDQSVKPTASLEKERVLVVNVKKQVPYLSRVQGSMSDRIVVDHRKTTNIEAKTLERWSSASVRDCLVLKGNSMPVDYKPGNSVGSISPSKGRPITASRDESFRNASFDRRRRPQSMTSVSTLSSYDFDRASHWGSHDAINMVFNSTNTGHGWQYTNNMEDGSRDQSIRRSRAPSAQVSSTILDPNVSVISYTLSDCESENEEEHSLLHTVSYARAWLNRNMQNDEENDDDYEDDEDDNADCLIDLEANAKAWATAWAFPTDPVLPSTKGYGGSSFIRPDSMGSSNRSQRELHAAALKRKYHKEFAEKHQAIVVSSHCEDHINTFTFPHMSDYEDDLGANSFKIFNYTGSDSDVASRDGNRVNDSKRSVRGYNEGLDYDSLAVEKRSRDPYVDFRDSMVEMVLQKQMHKSSELEELLQSFLCLNSLEYHELIVQAFSEVWEKVFGSINGFHRRP